MNPENSPLALGIDAAVQNTPSSTTSSTSFMDILMYVLRTMPAQSTPLTLGMRTTKPDVTFSTLQQANEGQVEVAITWLRNWVIDNGINRRTRFTVYHPNGRDSTTLEMMHMLMAVNAGALFHEKDTWVFAGTEDFDSLDEFLTANVTTLEAMVPEQYFSNELEQYRQQQEEIKDKKAINPQKAEPLTGQSQSAEEDTSITNNETLTYLRESVAKYGIGLMDQEPIDGRIIKYPILIAAVLKGWIRIKKDSTGVYEFVNDAYANRLSELQPVDLEDYFEAELEQYQWKGKVEHDERVSQSKRSTAVAEAKSALMALYLADIRPYIQENERPRISQSAMEEIEQRIATIVSEISDISSQEAEELRATAVDMEQAYRYYLLAQDYYHNLQGMGNEIVAIQEETRILEAGEQLKQLDDRLRALKLQFESAAKKYNLSGPYLGQVISQYSEISQHQYTKVYQDIKSAKLALEKPLALFTPSDEENKWTQELLKRLDEDWFNRHSLVSQPGSIERRLNKEDWETVHELLNKIGTKIASDQFEFFNLELYVNLIELVNQWSILNDRMRGKLLGHLFMILGWKNNNTFISAIQDLRSNGELFGSLQEVISNSNVEKSNKWLNKFFHIFHHVFYYDNKESIKYLFGTIT